MNIKLGSVNARVAAGDAFRKIGAQETFYDVLEDTVFVETDAPTGPDVIHAVRAKFKSFDEEISRWEELAASTDFD